MEMPGMLDAGKYVKNAYYITIFYIHMFNNSNNNK